MNKNDLKFNIRFLRCVKRYPIIYNTKLKEYKSRHCADCRNTAWRAIAGELNCDPLALKKKWKNFRTIATRKVRQEQLGQRAPPYYLYDHIKFLLPYLRTTCGGVASNNEIKDEEEEEKMYEEDDEDDVDDPDNQYESDLEQSVNEIEDEDPIYFDYNNDEVSSQNTSKSLPDQEETFEKDNFHVSKPTGSQMIAPSLNKITTQTSSRADVASSSTGNVDREQLASIEKAKKQFLDSLLPDLNQMSHSQMRQFKYKVLELIDQILIEN